ncbi:MAG: EF2563 family selenium-dependent molybdenum hydroxylase system protein [Deltaproteobacteria bacterium]|nr:EF2563 family selenium-dependent molybdenum hydroxylase system protein [Deltaproteobacteria bacterium]
MNKKQVILVKGAGEKSSAVAHGLFSNGYKRIIMTDLPYPLAERRGVCFCEAAIEQKKEVKGVFCEKAGSSVDSVNAILSKEFIPLLIAPNGALIKSINPDIIIDGILAKKNTGTAIDQAPLVIALGPGFYAGKDVHYVIETNPNIPDLGKIIEDGCAEEHTGIPTEVMGKSLERLLTSPGTGTLYGIRDIGNSVKKGGTIGYVGERKLISPISGIIWGLIRTPASVKEGQKLGDIHPGNDRSICYEITPQAKTIAGAVIEAISRRYSN